MKVLLRDIPPEGLEVTSELDPENLHLQEEGVTFQGPVQVELSISKQEALIYATGQVRAEVSLECGLCLRHFPFRLSQGLQAEYVMASKVTGKEEHELKREEMDVIFYSGDSIEFDDLIREQVILGIPMQPLCAQDCRGLCPRCGQDLNAGTCSCPPEAADPRFSALKDYFKDRRLGPDGKSQT